MCRDIEVADDQVNEIGEACEITKTTGAVLNDLDDAVEAFADRVGEWAFDEGDHMRIVLA